MSASCLYEGTIRHRRRDPTRDFTHRLALAYLDLDEVPDLPQGRLVRRGPGVVRYRRSDYLGDPAVPLGAAVRDRVLAATGVGCDGPVRVLTNLRSFGHCFNPVSFYYCFDPSGRELEALIAEVTNTPWGERHAYVLPAESSGRGRLDGGFEKALHVSPFMGMDHHYRLRAGVPGSTLSVHVDSSRRGEKVFDATLRLERRELTRGSLAASTARYPFATLRVLALIYRRALGLKLAGAPVHGHPQASAS